mmetsp:Transcript_7721/g.22096  ORF Transcript_7721/g.22096 Transcript_7721/m.22096 type:complete len:294 (+) Transcript_7721:279-1160(+)
MSSTPGRRSMASARCISRRSRRKRVGSSSARYESACARSTGSRPNASSRPPAAAYSSSNKAALSSRSAPPAPSPSLPPTGVGSWTAPKAGAGLSEPSASPPAKARSTAVKPVPSMRSRAAASSAPPPKDIPDAKLCPVRDCGINSMSMKPPPRRPSAGVPGCPSKAACCRKRVISSTGAAAATGAKPPCPKAKAWAPSETAEAKLAADKPKPATPNSPKSVSSSIGTSRPGICGGWGAHCAPASSVPAAPKAAASVILRPTRSHSQPASKSAGISTATLSAKLACSDLAYSSG